MSLYIGCREGGKEMYSGTGFIIKLSQNYFFVTCNHVLNKGDFHRIGFWNNSLQHHWLDFNDKSIRKVNEDYDIAYFQIQDNQLDINKQFSIDIGEQGEKKYPIPGNSAVALYKYNQNPTQIELEGLDAIEDLLCIGFPEGLISHEKLPICRFARNATLLSKEFELGKGNVLLDGGFFGGSSGSPVFLSNVGMYHEKGENGFLTLNSSKRVRFLGMVNNTHTNFNQVHINLGEMISVSKIFELINQNNLS